MYPFTETPQTGSISWCSVAAHLPNRNNKDCRKRWHYSIAHGHTIRKGTWTREEDQRLRDAVVIHGTRWSKIAQVVGTRNGDQCWKRWYDCLDPQIDKSPWTPEEVSIRYQYDYLPGLILTLTEIQGRQIAPNGGQTRPKLDRNRQQTLPKTDLPFRKEQI